MLQEIANHAAHGRSFAFETTLSGLTYARMIDDWRSDDYDVRLIFISLPAVETAIMRVATRVRQGGHHIPEDTIRRRFELGWRNFNAVYRARVDSWQLYDNGGDDILLVDEGENQ